jgi:hypothetical protein
MPESFRTTFVNQPGEPSANGTSLPTWDHARTVVERRHPLTWAGRVAGQYMAQLDRKKWPVHKIDAPDGVASDALILPAYRAPEVEIPPAFLRGVIYNTIQWEVVGRGRKGEPLRLVENAALRGAGRGRFAGAIQPYVAGRALGGPVTSIMEATR